MRPGPYAFFAAIVFASCVWPLRDASPPAGPDSSDPAATGAALLSNVRQLVFAGRRSGEGYFGPDGATMIFQSEREPENPFYQIYLLDLRTGAVDRVSPGTGKTTCGWIHPGGERVLFASTHHDPATRTKQKEELESRASGVERRYQWDYDEHFDVFVADRRGRRLENLTDTRGYDAEASWSPDGETIVFASNRSAYERALDAGERKILERDPSFFLDLYAMRSDGSDVRRLTDTPGYDGGPFFSADGEKIVWRRFSEDGRMAEIFVMNADGSGKRRITRLGRMSWAPFFHPSGDYVVFTSNLPGAHDFELFLVDAEGQADPVRVTESKGFDGLPSFSPDGNVLSWTSGRTQDGKPQIFLARWNDADARRLLGLDSPTRAAAAVASPAATAAAGGTEDLRRWVETLASERMGGRFTGTAGARRATAYVASRFRSFGLEPAGDDGSYFQSFDFTGGVSLGDENRLVVKTNGAPKGDPPMVDRDWRPLTFSASGPIESAGVVFAGYGIVAPEVGGMEAYDSYGALDVEDKWVLVFRYFPEAAPAEVRRHLTRHSNLRYKAMLARDRGARGLLVVSGPNAQVKNELVPLTVDVSIAGTSLSAISIDDALANRLLEPSGRTLRELQDALDGGDFVEGFPIPEVEIEARIDLVREKRTGRNVLARLPAGDEPTAEIVVIGAHVDHLGRGEAATSLARDAEKGEIHYGADDNASGVAGLLRIARSLAEARVSGRLRLRRDVLLAAWSGEEIGLLGSSHFARRTGGEDGVVAYLNMDMIGRLRDGLVLQGVGSSADWPAAIEQANAPVGIPIVLQDDTYVPTDATSFYLKEVPFLAAFTGGHDEYHTPRDTPDRLDYAGIGKISRLVERLARRLATSGETPEYRKMTDPRQSASRRGLRAYLGTIPDYTESGVSGVKLAGVVAGGPAERAGLREGDVIVELDGRAVENIYDYTYVLQSVRVGEPVPVVVRRDGEGLELTLTPESRD